MAERSVREHEWVEVSHEALIRNWPRLRQWLDEDRVGLRIRHRLTEAAQEWERSGRDEGVLYRGSRLAAALEWYSHNQDMLNASERDFLLAAEALANREQRARVRRLRIAVAGLTVALLVIGAVAALAIRDWQSAVTERGLARSRGLAAQAVAQLQSDPELSVLLAQRAMQAADTPEAEDALRQAVFQSHITRVLHGHTNWLNDAAYSPDGRRIVTAGKDQTARIWDAATGKELAVLRSRKAVNLASFSPDGRTIVTAGDDGTARLWDARSGKQLHVLPGGPNAVKTAVFSPDGGWVVTGSDDGTARIWNAHTGALLQTLRGQRQGLLDTEFSPDSTRVVTASKDGTAWVWDVRSGRRLHALSIYRGRATQNGWVGAAVFSPNGKWIATADDNDDVARVWDARSGHLLRTLSTGDYVTTVAFSRDSSHLVVASNNFAVIWATGTWRKEPELDGHTSPIDSAQFSPDGKFLVTASDDKTARVWDVSTGAALGVLRGDTDAVVTAVFSPDGAAVLTASDDWTARVWDVRDLESALVLPGHAGGVLDAQFSPDGKRLVTAEVDHQALVFDALTGRRLLPPLPEKTNWTDAAVYSPNGALIAAASADDTVWFWNARTGALVGSPLNAGQNGVYDVAFDPKGRRLATAGSDGTTRIWDLPSRKVLHTLHGHTDAVGWVAFSPDGSELATGSDDYTARLWDVQTGKLLHVLKGAAHQVNVVQFSPDGRYLATFNDDHTVRIWDAHTGAAVATLFGTERYRGGAWSPDGRWIIGASAGNYAELWDWRSEQIIATFYGHGAPINMAAFSPDGTRIATASDDGTARIYTCAICGPIGDVEALARTRVTRQLTPQELRQYAPSS